MTTIIEQVLRDEINERAQAMGLTFKWTAEDRGAIHLLVASIEVPSAPGIGTITLQWAGDEITELHVWRSFRCQELALDVRHSDSMDQYVAWVEKAMGGIRRAIAEHWQLADRLLRRGEATINHDGIILADNKVTQHDSTFTIYRTHDLGLGVRCPYVVGGFDCSNFPEYDSDDQALDIIQERINQVLSGPATGKGVRDANYHAETKAAHATLTQLVCQHGNAVPHWRERLLFQAVGSYQLELSLIPNSTTQLPEIVVFLYCPRDEGDMSDDVYTATTTQELLDLLPQIEADARRINIQTGEYEEK